MYDNHSLSLKKRCRTSWLLLRLCDKEARTTSAQAEHLIFSQTNIFDINSGDTSYFRSTMIGKSDNSSSELPPILEQRVGEVPQWIYYINQNNGTTKWNPPAPFSDVPSGWEMRVAPRSTRVCYYNRNNLL